MKVVVCGGGAVGATCAYFLSRRGADVVVVERTSVACAASGKAGGFLALDWCSDSPMEALARRSFALHEALVDELGGDWGYRRMTTYSGVAGPRGDGAGPLPWLSSAVALHGRIGSPETTAQVHPARFTEALMRAAQEAGAQLVSGEVAGLSRDDAGAVCGVTVDGAEIAADRVVLAMGPWSIRAAGWLDLPIVHAVKGHSLVFSAEIPAEALFLEHRDAEGRTTSPEVFPRADGTVYVCAISSESSLPDDPAETVSDAVAIERLEAMCHAISPALSQDRVIARQACHRPITRDGLPLIGPVPGAGGAVVATGHGVWGILNAPATGEAVAELLLDGTSRTVDISPFDPGRLPPMRPDGRQPVTARRALGRYGVTRERN